MEARAHARRGDKSSSLTALHQAQSVFEKLDPESTVPSVLGIHDHLMRFCEGNTLTLLGEGRSAVESHSVALRIPTASRMDVSLSMIDSAICQNLSGEMIQACASASDALAILPVESRQGLPAYRIRELIDQINPKSRSHHAVRDLERLIR